MNFLPSEEKKDAKLSFLDLVWPVVKYFGGRLLCILLFIIMGILFDWPIWLLLIALVLIPYVVRFP